MSMNRNDHIVRYRTQTVVKCSWLLLFLVSTVSLFAQVEIKVDTTQIRIGEQIQYQLSTDKAAQVVFPQLKLDSLQKLEIVREFPIDTIKNRLLKKYLLTGFDSGNYLIPGQEMLLNGRRIFTDSILIKVGTVAVDTTKQGLYPIKPIYKAPPKTIYDYLYLLWWILGILVLLFLIWWFAFRSRKIIQWKPKPVLTPFDIALNQLKTLDTKNLIVQQKIKEYYTELTDIVRNYIEQDMKISAMEVTSDELVALLKKQNKYKKLGIPREQLDHLKLFLQNADLVKFAKAKPEETSIKNDRTFAETVLTELKTLISKPPVDEQGNPLPVEMQKEEILQKPSRKRRNAGIFIGVFLLFSVLGAGIWYYGFQYVKDTFMGHPSKELLEGKWYRASYGYPVVSMESPVVLKAVNVPLPLQVAQMLESMSTFAYGSYFSGFTIAVSSASYKEGTELSRDGAVQGAIQNLQNQKGISDVNYQVVDTQIEGRDAKKISGTLKADTKEMVFNAYMIFEGQTIRQIVIARSPNDTYAKEMEKRITDSLQLESVSQE